MCYSAFYLSKNCVDEVIPTIIIIIIISVIIIIILFLLFTHLSLSRQR